MNRIETLFQTKRQGILNVYCTAGYPLADSTLEVMQALQDNGVDMIELGMPYSDPLADGPVIQQSNAAALENGMTIQKLFDQLREFRHKIYLPVLLMGYMNPVLQYGFERFCQQAADLAIDGIILPDLPLFEYENEYGAFMRKYGLSFVFLITPETSEERIRKIDELTSGFIYAVSTSSTTGKQVNFAQQQAYFRKLQGMRLRNPVLVGFGIKDRETFQAACRHANGAIIGSAYISSLRQSQSGGSIAAATKEFLGGILS